ncbi:TadE family protein [Microbacterium sp. Gd 4-13]|uniref:TadE/TadG family type IV pilus assembly protein n=1 Tax=Microbacterium sp. Gd 4-13 TaxID=2173179 RepID=UPI000D572A1A|nr:TadE/TadG family type IV pilus assembly protein [Microbacterium sp. Gd 4-13]PVW06336.1 TadE family protein [Microbacterium sp. Gd 4-13]
MQRLRQALDDEEGSSPVEFVLVGGLLTLLTVAVLQLALAVYVRNVVHDAAVEGAFHAALADTTLAEGTARTRDLIGRAVATSYAEDVTAVEQGETVRLTVRTTLPLLGLWGSPRALEVTAHAPSESLG